MTADRRAALVEKVAQMFCSQVDLECSECKTEGGCWYTDTATAAIDLIRAETLEEAARVIDENMLCEDVDGTEVLLPRGTSGNKVGIAYAAAIRALKEKP